MIIKVNVHSRLLAKFPFETCPLCYRKKRKQGDPYSLPLFSLERKKIIAQLTQFKPREKNRLTQGHTLISVWATRRAGTILWDRTTAHEGPG